MRNLSHACLFPLALAAISPQVPPVDGTRAWDPTFVPRIDSLVLAYQDLDIFSGVVTIAVDGRPVYDKAFGLADRGKGIPNTVNTCFDIGSMNKTFTKVVVLQLADEGRLELDAPVGRYLDGFSPAVADSVTVRMLLAHRSGLGDYHDVGYFERPMDQRSIAGRVEAIRRMPLHFPPGSDRHYSNAGYVLLGAIIAKVTGGSYYDAVQARIVEPLGLKRTYLRDKYSVPQRAIGYYKDMHGRLLTNEHFQELPGPDGGFMSTTADILTFYRAYFYGHRLLTDRMRQQDDLQAFYRANRDNGKAIPQAGGFEGANTVIYEVPRDRLSILVFANMDEPVAEQLGAGILAIVRGQNPEPPTLPAIQAVYRALRDSGATYVDTHFEALTRNFHPGDPRDLILNQVGYGLLADGDTRSAIEVFAMNTRRFPEVANVWDSYGEGLLAAGDSSAALAAYRKALALDPALPSSLKAVERLSR